MVAWYCRRPFWVGLIRWSIVISVAFLVAWTYRSWFIHAKNFLSSPVYRECVNRRSQFSSSMAEISNHRKNLFVTMAHHGRLGNWMFQYASLLGIAKANGFTPYFTSWHSLNYYFDLTNIRREEADCLDVLDDPKPMSYIEKFNHLPLSNITLNGYFQSWKYFQAVDPKEIQREFRFTRNMERLIRQHFETYVGRHVRAGREVISIHVRRGDTLNFGAQRNGFIPAPAEYFVNAIHYMVKRHPYSVFLIVSDDIDWCRENIETVALKYYKENTGVLNEDTRDQDLTALVKPERIFIVNRRDGSEEPLEASEKNMKIYIENTFGRKKNESKTDNVEHPSIFNDNHDLNNKDQSDDYIYLHSPPLIIAPSSSSINDFGLLTLANHSIVSVGSYGWWGAWLAGGEVVYYEHWPAEDHMVYYHFTKEDYFPPHWVALSRGSRFVHRFGFINYVIMIHCCLGVFLGGIFSWV